MFLLKFCLQMSKYEKSIYRKKRKIYKYIHQAPQIVLETPSSSEISLTTA